MMRKKFVFTLMVLLALLIMLALANLAIAEQKVVFKCETFEYNRSNGPEDCDKKCAAISSSPEKMIENGWKIVTVIPNIVKEIEKFELGGGRGSMYDICMKDTMCRKNVNTINIDIFYPVIKGKGCKCIGNEYVMERSTTK